MLVGRLDVDVFRAVGGVVPQVGADLAVVADSRTARTQNSEGRSIDHASMHSSHE
ncbi:hypothetical protein [Halalkalicoccus tibetensis]|uniref:Uncharacterized protein n=1 Tax=Halalkalicoccus tibetensis TaxID=175632 RepID=A0ABD5V409_9EURY